MAEEEQPIVESLLRTGASGYDNIDKSEVGKQSDNGNEALPSSQYSVFPLQSTLHTSHEDKSILEGTQDIPINYTDSANKNLLHEPNPADEASQVKNYNYTGRGNKSDFSLWKLVCVDQTVLLNTGEEHVSLPTSVTPLDKPRLYFEEEKAFILAGKAVFEIKFDRQGTIIWDWHEALKHARVEDSQKEGNFDMKAVQYDDKEKHCNESPDTVSNSIKKKSDETVSDSDYRASGTIRSNKTLKGMSADADAKDKTDTTLSVCNYYQDTGDRYPKIHVSKCIGRPLDTVFSMKNDSPNSSWTEETIRDSTGVAMQVPEERDSCSANQQTEMPPSDETMEEQSEQSSCEKQTKNLGLLGSDRNRFAGQMVAQYQGIEKIPRSAQKVEQDRESRITYTRFSETEKEGITTSSEDFDNPAKAAVLKATDQERQIQMEQKLADKESEIDGSQRLKVAERATVKAERKDSDNGDYSTNVPSACSIGQLSEEYLVSPIYENIVELAKQQEQTKDLFSGVEVTFDEKDQKLFCIIRREWSISDSVVTKIKSLQEMYGTRDVGFKDIKYLSDIPEQEHMVLINELIKEIKTEKEFLFKIDNKQRKVFIAAVDQAAADGLVCRIRRGLDSCSLFLDEQTSNDTYAKELQVEICRAFSKKVVTQLDVAGRKIQLTGLKSVTETALEQFKIISKAVTVGCQELLMFIERELNRGSVASFTNSVLVERRMNHERIGFVIKGPAKQVCLLHDSIVQKMGNCDTSHIHIMDFGTLSFFRRNVGKEFVTNLTEKHNVIVEDYNVNKSVTSDPVQRIAHTLAAGHQIILTSLVDNINTDILEVHLQVSEDEHDICGLPKETHSSKTIPDHVTMFIPKYKQEKTKEKERLRSALKNLLEFVQMKIITKVILRLQEMGGWNFRKFVKQILFSWKDYASEGLKTPTIVYLLTPDTEKYKCAEEVFIQAFPDVDAGPQGSPLIFDETHFEIDKTRLRAPKGGIHIDVLLKDLLEMQADVFVYATDPSLDLQKGNISALLDARAGTCLQEELRKSYNGKKLGVWEFVSTHGYNLPYRCVLHGAIDRFENRNSLKKMQNFLYRCLEKADQLGMESVVFPALGTGRCGYRPENIAMAIFEAARCFDMNYPRSSLSQVFMVFNDEQTIKVSAKEIQSRHETNVFRVGKVFLRGRLTEIESVMTDCIIMLWDMKTFKSVRVVDCSLFIAAGPAASEQFMTKRDGNSSGRTFYTCGGNFHCDKIVHVPFNMEESKLESAFQDGIENADKSRCKSCVFYLPKDSPVLKYGDNIVKHLCKAIVENSDNLSNLTSVVVVFDSCCDKTFLQMFDKHWKAAAAVEQPQQILKSTDLTPSAAITTIKITGLVKNVKEAVEEFEAKLAQLQEPQSLQGLAMEPPREQKIFRGETKVKAEDPETGVSTHPVRIDKPFGKTIGEQNLTDPMKDIVESRIEGTKHTGLQSERSAKTDNAKQSAAVYEKTMQDTRKDMKYLVGSGDSVSKPARPWSPSLLALDENDCLCIEVEQIDEIETYKSLHFKILNMEFPCAPPKLIYPFERRDKALLKCRKPEDADLLELFTDRINQYTYKKLQPQSLQMMKVRLPRDYIIEPDGKINIKKKTKLEEIGILETPVSEVDINVTVFSFAQIKVLFDLLKTFEDGTLTNSLSGDSYAYKDSSHSGSHSEALSERNIKHYFTGRLNAVPEGSLFITDDDDTQTVRKGSPSDDILYIVEKIDDVSDLSWNVIIRLLANEIRVLKNKNIDVTFKNHSIYIEGHTDEATIDYIVKAIDRLKQMQTEEIKPTETADKMKYIQWCKDTNSALEKDCCVYDETNESFIAFGEDYTDISKVKHQLGIKQGTIKQTGRRRNRNLDTPAPPGIPEKKSSPRSLSPSLPDLDWSRDAKQKQEYTTDEGIKIYVYVADILKLPVDCIVNAANDTLQHGGGVAWVIAKAAGPELTREGDRIIKNCGLIPVGKACTTTAGLLPYDCVIHAVGPRWADYRPHTYKRVKECELLLQNAILSSFSEAENRSLKTIALPAISSAIFAVPEEMCAVQYAKAVINYSSGRADVVKTLKEIHFIDKNPTIISLIQRTFHRMITEKKPTDYDIRNYVTERSVDTGPRNLNSTSQRRLVESLEAGDYLPVYVDTVAGCELHSKNGSKVYLYDGNILEANHKRISSIVCADDDVGQGKGGLAKALKNKAKTFSYEADKNKAFNRQLPKTGDVVLSAGQGTGFENVLHAVLWDLRYKKDQKEIIVEAYRNILNEADLRYSAVASPLLGTGSYRSVSVEDSAKAFLNSYLEFCKSKKAGSKLSMYLVCRNFSDKSRVKEQFRNVLQRGELMSPKPARESYHDDKSDKEEHGKTSAKICAICMENVSFPKTLPCGHVFCVECIDKYLNNYKKMCPICGIVCGIIEGDQPEGKMSATVSKHLHCEGYEDCGRIDIVYDFPSGKQGPEHPEPGKSYTGIKRNAYLPNNEEGREILAMLELAFSRKLVFTIGRSRTTAKDGVITWNDIHHKTNPIPGGDFGYPDPGYLARVRDELAAKGVTVDDITKLSCGVKSFRSPRR